MEERKGAGAAGTACLGLGGIKKVAAGGATTLGGIEGGGLGASSPEPGGGDGWVPAEDSLAAVTAGFSTLSCLSASQIPSGMLGQMLLL